MMGMGLSKGQVQELMDGVDDDGSGELEFPEFKQIILEKLGLGEKKNSTEWEMNESGEWVRECSVGAHFGEKVVLHEDVSMVVTMLALEASTLAVLERADYAHIKAHGFDGELKKKVE
eukprot:evm.model.scf_25EXC.9 EVM.evm.TU.scf_25EXC.9   scf_25EXC:195040-196214(-)